MACCLLPSALCLCQPILRVVWAPTTSLLSSVHLDTHFGSYLSEGERGKQEGGETQASGSGGETRVWKRVRDLGVWKRGCLEGGLTPQKGSFKELRFLS